MSPTNKSGGGRCYSAAYDMLLGIVLALAVLALTGSIESEPAPNTGPGRIGCEVRASE